MPIKATFPKSWFTDEAGSSNSESASNYTTAGPSSHHRRASTAQASSSTTPRHEDLIDEDADLDITEDLTRKNSFEAVMEAAKRAEAEAAALEDREPVTKPTPAAQSSVQETTTHVQRRALPGPSAGKRPASAELIELANLPRFTRSSRWSHDAPATPPAAHLPRR